MNTNVRNISTEDLIHEYLITRGTLIRDELIKRYTPLARSIAIRYAKSFGERYFDRDDFIDWAMESLWSKGIERFDVSRRNEKKTLEQSFRLWIYGKIVSHIVDTYDSMLPMSKCGRAIALHHSKYLDSYFKEYGRRPTDEEIETHLSSLYNASNRGGAGTPLVMQPNRENIFYAVNGNRFACEVKPWFSFQVINSDDHIEGKDLFNNIFVINKYNLQELDLKILSCLYVDQIGVVETGKKLNISDKRVSNNRNRILSTVKESVCKQGVLGD